MHKLVASAQGAGFAHTPGSEAADKVAPLSPRKPLSGKFRAAGKFVQAANAVAKPVVIRSRSLTAGDSATHSMAEDECIANMDFINRRLGGDEGLAHLLPLKGIDEMWSSVADGILLCKLVNVACPDTIDERAINFPKKGKGRIERFHQIENLNLALNAAKGIGIKVINVGPEDMMEGRQHLILGLVWQIVKMSLFQKINLKENPFLIRLLQDGEELEDLLKLTPEELLTRWVNYHLERSGSPRRLKNFGPDLRDSDIYAHLLKQIDPSGECNTAILSNPNQMARAEYVVASGQRLGAEFTVRPADIIKANERLNLGFVAALFNACPGLDPPDEASLALFDELEEDDVGDSREERAFRMWINSLGLEGVHVNNLFDDMRDGIVLLKLEDHVKPGIVDWSKVNMQPRMVFKKAENCNYAVVLAKSPALKFSLVGVSGKDIVDGNKKLTLAIIWQLMRLHLTTFLDKLRKGQKAGGVMGDAEMVKWANGCVRATGRSSSMRDFNDKSLRTGIFLLDLLAAVEPRCVNRENVTQGNTDENRMLNSKYAIACARKLGCALFCLPEDLVEVRPKMILAFVASVMAVAHSRPPAID